MIELMEQEGEHFLDNFLVNEENDDGLADEQVDDDRGIRRGIRR